MKDLLYLWYSLEPGLRFYFNVAAAVILPILYFICKRLQKRWAWWVMLVCVTIPLFLGLVTFGESMDVNLPYFTWEAGENVPRSTVSWWDGLFGTFTDTVFILVFGFTVTHCSFKKEEPKP